MDQMKEKITVFPDTNILLHYPRIGEVDWLSLCNAKNVKIVICLQVIHELDEKKNDSLFSQRAKNAIRDIKQIRKSGNLTKMNVSLEVFNHELRNEDFPQTLSPDSGDDRIVYLVKKYQTLNPEDQIAILSEDCGMQLRCEANAISVFEPDDTTRLPSPKSKIEKEYQKTIQELNTLKNQSPSIKVSILNYRKKSELKEDMPLFINDLPTTFSLLNVEDEIKKEQDRLSDKPSTQEQALRGFEEFSRRYYSEKLDDYIDDYREWIECYNKAQPLLSLSFAFSLAISNEGTIPAEELSVTLEFPPLFGHASCWNGHFGKFPHIPEKPIPPKKDEGVLSGLFRKTGISNNFIPPRIYSRFDPIVKFEDVVDTFKVNFHIPKLNHYEKETFRLYAGFKSVESLHSFNVDVEVIAANIPQKEVFKIPIRVEPVS